MTTTTSLVVHKTAVGPRKRLDLLAGSLKTLAKCSRFQGQCVGGLDGGQVEDLPEHVGEAKRAVEALQHRERAAHLYLLREHALLRVCRTVVGEAVEQISGERVEAQFLAF